MRIEPREMFGYRGRVFETQEKAVDFAESLVADAIKHDLLQRGFTVSEWVKISRTILTHRETLLDLLDY